MERGVACAEATAVLTAEARVQSAPNGVRSRRRATYHGGVVRQPSDHPHLRQDTMGLAVFHKASVDAVGGAGGAAVDVGGVDLEDVQQLKKRVI